MFSPRLRPLKGHEGRTVQVHCPMCPVLTQSNNVTNNGQHTVKYYRGGIYQFYKRRAVIIYFMTRYISIHLLSTIGNESVRQEHPTHIA